MATLVLAGHVTTSNTLSWMLYELANHQEYQTKMREEIAAARTRLNERGAQDFSVEDIESMPLVSSCLKVRPRLGRFTALLNTAPGNAEVPWTHLPPFPERCSRRRHSS